MSHRQAEHHMYAAVVSIAGTPALQLPSTSFMPASPFSKQIQHTFVYIDVTIFQAADIPFPSVPSALTRALSVNRCAMWRLTQSHVTGSLEEAPRSADNSTSIATGLKSLADLHIVCNTGSSKARPKRDLQVVVLLPWHASAVAIPNPERHLSCQKA